MRESKISRLEHRAGQTIARYGGIVSLTSALWLAAQMPAAADKCGMVSCMDVTADYTVRVITNVMKDMGTDCRSVRTVRLLDKSVDNFMMIYDVR